MFPILVVSLTALLLPSGLCFYVEINLNDNNESRNIKLLCGPPAQNFNVTSKHKVLWHGSQFGSEEQKKLTENLLTDVSVPNISINSSKRHLCYILADENSLDKLIPLKKRVSRDSSASVPAENGICKPGHRIDQDRCYPCFPGSYTSGQDAECFLCPKDFYMDKKGADSCWPCPDGKKTLAQGADSEEACVYFDDAGHAVITQNPPWILIYSLIAVIIICVWIIIIILAIRYWKEWRHDESNQVADFEKRMSSARDKTTAVSRRKDNGYKTLSGDSEDHIYAEVGDYDDISTYEVPRKFSDPHDYLDLEAPTLPPKVADFERRMSSATDRTTPISRSKDNGYKTLSGDLEDHTYAEVGDYDDITKCIFLVFFRYFSGCYEAPRKFSDPHDYLDLEAPTLPPERREESMKSISHRISSDQQYEIPIQKISRAEHEIPLIRRSPEEGFYKIPIEKESSQYEVPVQRGSDLQYTEFISDPEDHIYDTVQDMSDEQKNISSNSESSKNLAKTHSMGFEPTASLVTARKVQSDVKFSTGNKKHNISSKNRHQSAMIP